MATILIVDDEKHIRTHLATFVRSLGHTVELAESGEAALEMLARQPFDVVLSDVRMAQTDGLVLLRRIKERDAESVVVLMTAYATVPEAVEAMRTGAYDYLVKPFALDHVGLVLGRALEMQRLRRENRQLRQAIDDPILLTSASPAMRSALATAERAARSEAAVLLTGESGTGKTVLARQIHAWSARAAAPFVTIACTTLAEHLLESELFGHVKGAFTGAFKDKPGRVEAAEHGTLFLDEVGELPLELQAKLLRFLEEHRFERVGGSNTRTVDARVIAATNRDLEAEVDAGRFRSDLYFRLNVIGIRLPALRERSADLPALIDHVLAVAATRHGRPLARLSDEARAVLAAYRWPGNVRELVNAVERAVVLSTADIILADDLPDRLVAPAPQEGDAQSARPDSLETMERRHIEQTLAESATLEEAAARLGINVTTLWRKRKRYGID
jgi:NtrC-family two-component system response regulator AlgB